MKPGLQKNGSLLNLNFTGLNMQNDDTEQPLTDHLVDQFASYFLLTMLTFHLFGYVKKQYEKRMAEEKLHLSSECWVPCLSGLLTMVA